VWNFDSNLSWDQMLAVNTAKMQQNLAARNYRPNTRMTPGEFVHNFGNTVRLTEEFKNVVR
jgi:hypothetical protein